MTTYRILLVITAACSALITAFFINPADSNRVFEPAQIIFPPALIQAPETSDNDIIENAEPLTLAIKVCFQNKCEYLAQSEMQNILTRDGESMVEREQYQTTVPFQLPQQGVPIIEM